MFGIAMGYFFALAKFIPSKRTGFLAKALLVAILLYGVYDVLLMVLRSIYLLKYDHKNPSRTCIPRVSGLEILLNW
jgi:RsiW-degrading membrane proteinase PrsW (M82 family)